MNRFKVTGLSLIFLGLIAALISGCAVGPYVAPPTSTITINTIPSGADISIQGNYIGKSPVVITKPQGYRGNEQIKIEAVLEGYETKNISHYYPPVDEVLKRSLPDGTKTILDIKLDPKTGGTSAPSTPRIPVGVYQATRTYGNGDKYIGEFLNGAFHGKGLYTYANGDKYEGEFINGKFTGKGTFTCSNGKQFTGIIENKVPLEYTIRCN